MRARPVDRVVDVRQGPRVGPDGHDVLGKSGVSQRILFRYSGTQALERFRLLRNTASLRAGWLEKRLCFQEDLRPLIEARMDAPAGGGPGARAVIATAFACLDAASMAWVDRDGEGDIMNLYDECLAAVRS